MWKKTDSHIWFIFQICTRRKKSYFSTGNMFFLPQFFSYFNLEKIIFNVKKISYFSHKTQHWILWKFNLHPRLNLRWIQSAQIEFNLGPDWIQLGVLAYVEFNVEFNCGVIGGVGMGWGRGVRVGWEWGDDAGVRMMWGGDGVGWRGGGSTSRSR